MTAGERQRLHREWVASGGPARAAAIRATLPTAVRVAREAAVSGTTKPTTRSVDAKLERMADAKVDLAKRQAELRARARRMLAASDALMLTRARRRLASIRNRDNAIGFELTGLVPDDCQGVMQD